MAVNYDALAGDIVAGVGGVENIRSARHCATRLRLDLRDETKADTDAIKGMDGVITVVQAGGQYQIVVGDNVPLVHAGVIARTGQGSVAVVEADEGPKGSLMDRFIRLISGVFTPMLWTLAGAGLFKAFLSMFVTFNWIDPASTEHLVLNAASDAIIYFLPVVLAATSANYFKANQITSIVLAGALVYPSVVALASSPDPVTLFGLPLAVVSYTGSVFPIILAVWLQSHFERFLGRVLPAVIRNFTVPLLVLLVMVPLILLTVGPALTYLGNGLASGVDWLFATAPWLAGAVMGGGWQVFVLFGLHYGFTPVYVQQVASGWAVIAGPLVAAIMAQSAATLAVAVRTKDPNTRKLAGPAALSGILAGVTEPAIYGVNLPRKLPFYFGIVGGAIGGALGAIAGAGSNALVLPSLLSIPAFLGTPNLPLFFIGVGIAAGVAFVLTFFFGVKDPEKPASTEPATKTPAMEQGAVTPPLGTELIVAAPVSGSIVALGEVPDPVFSSGKMGSGLGIVPANGTIVAPIAGKIVVAMASGHAYGIKGDNGVEVLVHVGLDTVNMNGEGFDAKVSRGDRVEAGQILAEVDLSAIDKAGYSTTTVLIVTNTAAMTKVEPVTGDTIKVNQPAIIVTK